MPNLPLVKHIMAAVGANTARALKQVMKPHIPSIKFPKREPVSELQAAPVGNPNSLDFLLSKNVASKPSGLSGSKTAKGPSIESSELPIRFQRKPLTHEEMEYIEKGGPV